MTTKATGTGKDIDPIPSGMHHAICYAVVDIGTQEGMYGPKPQLVVIWELPGERIQYEKNGVDVDLPRAYSQRYTLSIHEKSNLGQHLTGWRGRPFTAEEKAGFDVRNIAGVNCLMNLIHEPKEGGGVRVKIASINPLPSTMPKKKAENPIVKYDIEEDGMCIPETLPDWVKDEIKKSKEYVTLSQGGSLGSDVEYDDMPLGDDGIPF